jgi:hypothetical protein
MSIEALIQAHTEALLSNTEAVKLLTLSLAGRTPAKSEDKPKAEKAEKASAKTEQKKDEKAAEKASTDEAQEAIDKDQDEKADALSYETVRTLVLKLAGAGKREEIKALNTKHGIANLKVLLDKEEDFSTVNDQVKLEAVYADLQALEG